MVVLIDQWVRGLGGNLEEGNFQNCWHPLEWRGCCCRTVFSSQSLSFPHAVSLLLRNLCRHHHWRMLAQAYLHLQFKLTGRSWVEPSRGRGVLGFTTSSSSSLRQGLVQRVVEDNSETRNLLKETCYADNLNLVNA